MVNSSKRVEVKVVIKTGQELENVRPLFTGFWLMLSWLRWYYLGSPTVSFLILVIVLAK